MVSTETGQLQDYASRHLEEASDDGLREMDAAKSRFHGAVKALKQALKAGNKAAIVSARAELAASQGAAAGLVSKGAGLDAQRLLGKATPGTQTSDLAGEGDAKGESKTTPSSQPRLPGIIYVTGHEVELGGVSTGEWHSALEYTKPGPGEKPETRSAGPGGAYDLVSGKNRPSDAPENNSTLTVVDPPEGMSSEEYWNVLRVADSNYVDSDWDYDMYGSDPGEEGWNCNSWTVGIIQATGGTMRTRLALLPHSFSGTSNPVPPRAFKPK